MSDTSYYQSVITHPLASEAPKRWMQRAAGDRRTGRPGRRPLGFHSSFRSRAARNAPGGGAVV